MSECVGHDSACAGLQLKSSLATIVLGRKLQSLAPNVVICKKYLK